MGLLEDMDVKIQNEFALLRAEILINQDISDFQTAEFFLKALAVRDYFLCPKGKAQISALTEEEQLQLYAASNLCQLVCSQIDGTDYGTKAGLAVEAYCKQLRKEEINEQRGTTKATRGTLP